MLAAALPLVPKAKQERAPDRSQMALTALATTMGWRLTGMVTMGASLAGRGLHPATSQMAVFSQVRSPPTMTNLLAGTTAKLSFFLFTRAPRKIENCTSRPFFFDRQPFKFKINRPAHIVTPLERYGWHIGTTPACQH
jgi:hypothetical protein